MRLVDYKKIMIATYVSECSKLAIDKGIEFARLSGGTVYAVYVISTAYLSPRDGGWELIHEELKNQGQQAVDYIKKLGEVKGINVESVLLEGNPSDELSRYADKEKMDLLLWAPWKDRIRQDTSGQCCRKSGSSLEGSCYGCEGKV